VRSRGLILQYLSVLVVGLVIYLAFEKWHWLPIGAAPQLPDSPAERRAYLVKYGGGSAESEAAVARGLDWLARQQKDDGHWEFDGSSKDQVAATGMALLPFLAAGHSEKDAKYQRTVSSGVDWLVGKMGPGGSLGTNNMYAHAIATIALCEAAGRTKDEALKDKTKAVVSYIIGAQGKNGSWGYTGPAPSEGDTSIVGWQVQALAAAKFADIKVDGLDGSLKGADKFLESVSTDSGAKYGYRERGASQTLTPVGLLSRTSTVTFSERHPALGRGMEFLKGFPPQKGYFDMYFYYYATRVMFVCGGSAWHKFWNPKMRDMLVELQVAEGESKGSWDKDQGFMGSSCGRLGTTAMSLLTLEVYYRYPPPKWLAEIGK
jgi:hypothetical protein